MKHHYNELRELGCFSRGDIANVLGSDGTAGALVRESLEKGYIERVRRDLYTFIDLKTKQPVVSRYQIGCALYPDAVIANHSAFELFGLANQVFYEVYIYTDKRFADFRYNGVSYHRLLPKNDMDIVCGGGIRMTSLEQTVVDSIADFRKVTGLEEVLRCIMLVPALDEEKLLRILETRDSAFLWQKCGYILEELNADLGLSPAFFERCHAHIPSSRHALTKELAAPLVPSQKWNLYVPESLHSLTDKGVDFDAWA